MSEGYGSRWDAKQERIEANGSPPPVIDREKAEKINDICRVTQAKFPNTSVQLEPSTPNTQDHYKLSIRQDRIGSGRIVALDETCWRDLTFGTLDEIRYWLEIQ